MASGKGAEMESIPADFSLLKVVKLLRSNPDAVSPLDIFHAFLSLVSAPDATVAAFLTLLSTTTLETDPRVLSAAARALRLQSVALPHVPHAVDIVGTGGDGKDTFNVSTCAAIVAAGAGATVVKHGNKASTSSSGSSDLLGALGYDLDFPLDTIPDIVQGDSGAFVFLHAARFHPAIAKLAPIRHNLGFRTIFNLLGPLLNPARPSRMILGVPTPELCEPFALALQELRVSGMVVCGDEGLDEISCAGMTHIWTIDHADYSITQSSVQPADFGLPVHSLCSVKGGSAAVNASIFRHIVDGSLPPPPGVDILAIKHYILMNEAALLVVSGHAKTWLEGVCLAGNAIEDGRVCSAMSSFHKTRLSSTR